MPLSRRTATTTRYHASITCTSDPEFFTEVQTPKHHILILYWLSSQFSAPQADCVHAHCHHRPVSICDSAEPVTFQDVWCFVICSQLRTSTCKHVTLMLMGVVMVTATPQSMSTFRRQRLQQLKPSTAAAKWLAQGFVYSELTVLRLTSLKWPVTSNIAIKFNAISNFAVMLGAIMYGR